MVFWSKFTGVNEYLGPKNHRATISYQLGSDVNLIFIPVSTEWDEKGNIPGKFYEYLRAGKPILAIVPEGITKKIINKHKL
jgi:hypothetical protein